MKTIQVSEEHADQLKKIAEFLESGHAADISRDSFSRWCDRQLNWISLEREKYDNAPLTPSEEVGIWLIRTGEGFMGPKGMEVSDRVINWCYTALGHQEGPENAARIASRFNDPLFWWFCQHLSDEALTVLINTLKKEFAKQKNATK